MEVLCRDVNPEAVRRSKLRYISASWIRLTAKGSNRRVSREFLEALNRHVFDLVVKSCAVHNGGKKTLDALVFNYAAGKLKG